MSSTRAIILFLAVVAAAVLSVFLSGDPALVFRYFFGGLCLSVPLAMVVFLQRETAQKKAGWGAAVMLMVFVAVGLLAAFGYERSPLGLAALGIVACIIIILPLVTLGLVRFIKAREGKTRLSGLKFIGAGVGFAALIGIVIPLSREVRQQQLEAAFAYPTQVVPLLETYRKTHGTYPVRLDDLPSKPSLPSLLRHESAYGASQDQYLFSFPVPDLPDRNWNYDSEYGQWATDS